MTEFNGKDRRRAPRKDAYLPIKLSSQDNLIASGRTLNICCYGLKLGLEMEITFKTREDKERMDEVLSSKVLKLEIGERNTQIHMETAVEVRWSECSYGEGEKIYDAGLELKLNEEQKRSWEAFFEKL